MSETPADAVPERILLAAKNDYLQGFERLLGLARRELRIFDPDLAELDMNSTRRIETLARFLRGSRTHRICIALHDVEHVAKRCPRLITLLGSYTAGIFILQTQGEAAKVEDCFVLADGDHLLRPPATTRPRGRLPRNDPQWRARVVQPMLRS